MKVVVAGAGVFGSCIALELARAGAEVTVVDPKAFGDNASGVAAGMLAPAFECLFDDRPEHFADLLRARDLWPDFAASIGVEINRAGAVAVSFDEDVVDGWSRGLEMLGVAGRRLPSAEVARTYSGLANGLSGVSVDADWRLDARRALAALRAEGDRLGVVFSRSAVVDFTPGHATLDDGTHADNASILVIATGASPRLTRLAPELARLTPIKGHILEVAGARIGPTVVRFDGGYLCPTADGVLLGATMEVGRADTVVDANKVQDLLATAGRYMPGLDHAAVTVGVGVRAATADGPPLVGPSETEGVWLAVGARRNGWLLAPMVARAIAREIAGS